jgi:hypothetical protein
LWREGAAQEPDRQSLDGSNWARRPPALNEAGSPANPDELSSMSKTTRQDRFIDFSPAWMRNLNWGSNYSTVIFITWPRVTLITEGGPDRA